MKGTFVLRNAEGKYLCSTYDNMAYVWLHESEFSDRIPGPGYYLKRDFAERAIINSASPKHVQVGNSQMTRPDYPDMSTAYVEAV